MKAYVKLGLIALAAIAIIVAIVMFINFLVGSYNKPVEEEVLEEPEFVEVAVDLEGLYPNASESRLETLYNGQLLELDNHPMIEGGHIYLPVDLVIEYINTSFFYDPAEKILTYTSVDQIVRIRPDEESYTINDEPLKLDIGILDRDGVAYIPLSFVQKFAHHDFVVDNAYHIMQIKDWYIPIETGEVFTNEETYIRQIPDDLSPYIYQVYSGMMVTIVGEEGDYYQVVTREGFVGYIRQEYIRSVTLTHSLQESVVAGVAMAAKAPPVLEIEGKLNLVWHQVFNMDANNQVAEKFKNATNVDVISPTWFELDGTDGDITSLADLNYVRWAHDNGYQVWALFNNLKSGYTRDMTHQVLSSTEKRAKVIEQLMAYCELYELDGINIDLEAIPEADGPYYVQFVKELSVYLKLNGLAASADLPVVKSWTMHYGRAEISKYLDYVMVMGYDEHWGTSPVAGPVASITWTDEGISETLKEVPKEKLIIGIPFYTRIWYEETIDGEVKVSSKAYSMDYAKEVMDEHNVEWVWDDEIKMHYAEFTQDGIRHRMWLEDLQSVEERMKVAQKYDVGGVASWKIGLENDGVWEIIEEYMH